MSGDYQIESCIGTGKTSCVYLVEKEGKRYAAKIVNNDDMAMDERPSIHVHSLALELRILRDLPHPNIITLHEVIKQSETTCLILDFMKDGDLYDECPDATMLPRVVQGVAAGLQWLHRHNIVHRDIKPENILLDGDTVKLCDFGLSVDMGSHETVTSAPSGTLNFMAPETFAGRTHRGSDAWSLGATLYEMSVGCTPFEEALTWRTTERILRGAYTWPSSHRDASLRDLVEKLLVLEPALRLTMEQVLQHPWVTEITPPLPRRVLRSGAQRNVDASRDCAKT